MTEIEELKRINQDLQNVTLNLFDRWALLDDIASDEVRALMYFVEKELRLVVRTPVAQ